MKHSSRIVEDLVNSLFDVDTADLWLTGLKQRIDAPIVQGTKSTLGGAERVSISVRVVLDPRESWANGILENARYFNIWINRDGTMECTQASGPPPTYRFSKKFRKTKCRSLEDAIDKINQFIDEII